jgi:hypothetical protein
VRSSGGGAITTLKTEEMLALIDLHTRLEMIGELDKVMATMAPESSWGTPGSSHFHVGHDTVRRHYASLLPPPGQPKVDSFRGWADEAAQSAVGYWRVCLADGTTYPIAGVFTFEDGLITGEEPFHGENAPGCRRDLGCGLT